MAIPGEKAIQMVRNAHAEAAKLDIAVAAAVVDEAGAPIALGRMDGAEPRTAELAFNKAYTAAAFHLATAEVVPQPWLQSLVISHRGRIMPAGGGIAIIDGITIVSAVGVAGGRGADVDILCCQAALAVLDSPGH